MTHLVTCKDLITKGLIQNFLFSKGGLPYLHSAFISFYSNPKNNMFKRLPRLTDLCADRSAFPEMSATLTSLEQYAVNCLIIVWTCWPSSLVGTRIRALTFCSRTVWGHQRQKKWSGGWKGQRTRRSHKGLYHRNTLASKIPKFNTKYFWANDTQYHMSCDLSRSFSHLFGGKDALYDRYSVSSGLSRPCPGSGQKIFSLQG